MAEISPADWQVDGQERMTDKQRRMLNAVCGDLSKQLRWHGLKMSKDSWRYFFSGVSLGFQTVPGWDFGDGITSVVMLGRSSNDLSKSKAREAITMAVHLGDHPDEQGIQSKPVRWSDTVLYGLGFSPQDLAA